MPNNIYGILNGRKTDLILPKALDTSGLEKFTVSVKTNDTLNVRFLPNLSGEPLTKLSNGTSVFKISEKDDWYFIFIPDSNISGWVNKNYLKKV